MKLVSVERWTEFYEQIAFVWTVESGVRFDESENTPNIPENISDLKIKSIVKGASNRALFGLAGCFDHGIHLRVINENDKKSIEIVWGEHETAGSKLLWKND
jgi:hypothetical protein